MSVVAYHYKGETLHGDPKCLKSRMSGRVISPDVTWRPCARCGFILIAGIVKEAVEAGETLRPVVVVMYPLEDEGWQGNLTSTRAASLTKMAELSGRPLVELTVPNELGDVRLATVVDLPAVYADVLSPGFISMKLPLDADVSELSESQLRLFITLCANAYAAEGFTSERTVTELWWATLDVYRQEPSSASEAVSPTPKLRVARKSKSTSNDMLH